MPPFASITMMPSTVVLMMASRRSARALDRTAALRSWWLSHEIPTPIAMKNPSEVTSGSAPMASGPDAGKKKYTALTAERTVARIQGPSPPYQAATMIAGKNCRYGTLPASHV
jgi:hypothetical protein